MGEKMRLDLLMCEQGLADSRQRAQQYIMAGQVYVDGRRVDKAGTLFGTGAAVEYRGDPCPFVSRGGYKLDKAIHTFSIDLKDKCCMDIGASTGGFTDCMLQNGARRVYAVDVGYGQLAWKLRCDERVVNIERTNIRKLTAEQMPEKADFAGIDVSFISLKTVIPAALPFLREDAQISALIKPQFEAGRELVGKNGVVREQKTHIAVIEGMLDFCRERGLVCSGLSYSPVRGPKGNIEFLLYIGAQAVDINADETVRAAHSHFGGDEK